MEPGIMHSNRARKLTPNNSKLKPYLKNSIAMLYAITGEIIMNKKSNK